MNKFFQCFLMVYGVMLLIFVVLDGIWFGLVVKNLYMYSLFGLLRDQFIVWLWVLFYLGYCGVILYLVVIFSQCYCLIVFVCGVVLGVVVYGVYNFICYLIIVDWLMFIMLIDWMWGIMVIVLVSIFGVMIFCYIDF